MVNVLDSIYAILSAYLFTCSVILTIKAFSVGETYRSWRPLAHSLLQSINLSTEVTVGDKVTALLSGTNGVLMAALVSTFGECNIVTIFRGA
jgi:chitin synthase